jgi:SAM-dependent methyltransferase
MISPPTRKEMRALLGERVTRMSEHDHDEMAIPSYLHWNPLIRWLMWRRYELIADMLGGQVRAALEFGCGLGLFLPTLARAADEVYAVDIFPEYAQRLAARRRLTVRFLPDVASIADGCLDVVVAADVMEHLENPRATSVAFHRVLRAGGRLLVSGPTENTVYKAGRIAAGFAGKGDYHHTNIDRLKDDILATGFVLRETRTLPFGVRPHLFRVFRFEACAPSVR